MPHSLWDSNYGQNLLGPSEDYDLENFFHREAGITNTEVNPKTKMSDLPIVKTSYSCSRDKQCPPVLPSVGLSVLKLGELKFSIQTASLNPIFYQGNL